MATTPAEAAKLILDSAYNRLGMVLIVGNGGSAAMAQHLAAELMVRYKKERAPIAAVALTADTAVITAIANDYGYKHVFSRQIQGLGAKDSVLVVFSTSGRGEPLVEARCMARDMGMHIIEAPRVEGFSTADNQQGQLAWLHAVCEEIDNAV